MLNKAKQDKQQTIKEDKFTLSRLDVPLTSFSDQMEVYRKMINSFPLKELSLIYFLFKLDISLTKSFMLVQDVFFCFFWWFVVWLKSRFPYRFQLSKSRRRRKCEKVANKY